ncbi:uncharacterized protein LOC119365228 [Triticum dicoccoides]|uniref:uncharacterized protein LOC119365228 n=1 Tax=Triticum dicoccoides TaxID=85692 RepID=UPI000E7B8479|nr:uncharacterized protein LOC119365228 [Triticum dicoccoides]
MTFSITRKEIEGFWRRKEEERRLAAEKEAARAKAKTLKMEDYMLFEQMIREILEEGNEGDKGINDNRMMVAASSRVAELRIGIKHWWKKSTYAYLNEPAVTASMDDNGRSRRAVTYIPQDRCLKVRSAIPASFVIF